MAATEMEPPMDWPDGDDVPVVPAPTGSLLDQLGALREQRAAETTTGLPLPGFSGRLWATFRLPDSGRSSQLQVMIAGAASNLTGAACEYLADYCTGLYTADAGLDDDAKVRREDGTLAPGFQHLPGGTDELPITFKDARLERTPQLCPPRPVGKEHAPATRARALFGRDGLVIQAALMVNGWAVGGGLATLSEEFVGE